MKLNEEKNKYFFDLSTRLWLELFLYAIHKCAFISSKLRRFIVFSFLPPLHDG